MAASRHLITFVYLTSLLLHTASATFISKLYIPTLRTSYPRFRQQNDTLTFTFNDPNTNDPTSCNLTWPASSAPPTTTYGCSDSIYRFNIPSFNTISDFQLALAHTFEYDALGPPPWNYLTVFATINITKSENYTCSPSGTSCYIPDGMGPLVGIVKGVTG